MKIHLSTKLSVCESLISHIWVVWPDNYWVVTIPSVTTCTSKNEFGWSCSVTVRSVHGDNLICKFCRYHVFRHRNIDSLSLLFKSHTWSWWLNAGPYSTLMLTPRLYPPLPLSRQQHKLATRLTELKTQKEAKTANFNGEQMQNVTGLICASPMERELQIFNSRFVPYRCKVRFNP